MLIGPAPKLCLIGCGKHSQIAHGPAMQAHAALANGPVLAACCDLDIEAARKFAQQFGFANAYSDIETMLLNEQPDAIVVVLPSHLSARVCEPLLRRGLTLLMEKPPALTTATLQSLIEAQDSGKARAMVGFNRRHTKLLKRAREILDEQLPPDERLRIDYEMIRANRRDRDFSITAVHAIDAISFLAGSAFTSADFDYHELPQVGPGVADIVMSARCVSGLRIGLSVQPMAGVGTERAVVHGRGRSLVLDLPMWGTQPLGHLRYWQNGRLVHDIAEEDDIEIAVAQHLRGGFFAEHWAFLQALRDGSRFTPELQDCIQQVRLMEAIENRTSSVLF